MFLICICYVLGLIFVFSEEQNVNPFKFPTMPHPSIESQRSENCEELTVLLFYKRVISSFLNHLEPNENKESFTVKFFINITSKDYFFLRNFISDPDQIDVVTLSDVNKLIVSSFQQGHFQTYSDDLKQLIINFTYVFLYTIIILLVVYFLLNSKFLRFKRSYYIVCFATLNFLWYAYITYNNKMLEKHELLEEYQSKCYNIPILSWQYWLNDCKQMKMNIKKDVIHELFLPKLILQCLFDVIVQFFQCLGSCFNAFVKNFQDGLSLYQSFIYTPICIIVILVIIIYGFTILINKGLVNKISFLGLHMKFDTSKEQFEKLIYFSQLLKSNNNAFKLTNDLEALLNLDFHKHNAIKANTNSEIEIFHDALSEYFEPDDEEEKR